MQVVIATAPTVIVKDETGGYRYFRRGDRIVGVSTADIDYLIEAGLASQVNVPEPTVRAGGPEDLTGGESGDGRSLDDLTVPELREWADAHDVDLAGATLRDDILAAVRQG